MANRGDRVPFLLVGLKTDLRNDQTTIERLEQSRWHAPRKPMQYEEGQKLASELGAFKYVEASSTRA